MFLTQKDYGLPLVVDELVGVLSLKLVDEFDEVAVMVLAVVLSAQACQLIPALDIVDAGLALLHQFLHETIPQRHVLCARTVGTVAGDMQRRCVIDIQWHAAELSSKPSSNIMLVQITASSFIVRATATSSVSIVDYAVSPCSPTSKMVGAFASVTMYDGADLPRPP